MMLTTFLVCLWWSVGFVGAIQLWRRKYDVEIAWAIQLAIGAMLGPLLPAIIWFVLGDAKSPIILFKKKGT